MEKLTSIREQLLKELKNIESDVYKNITRLLSDKDALKDADEQSFSIIAEQVEENVDIELLKLKNGYGIFYSTTLKKLIIKNNSHAIEILLDIEKIDDVEVIIAREISSYDISPTTKLLTKTETFEISIMDPKLLIRRETVYNSDGKISEVNFYQAQSNHQISSYIYSIIGELEELKIFDLKGKLLYTRLKNSSYEFKSHNDKSSFKIIQAGKTGFRLISLKDENGDELLTETELIDGIAHSIVGDELKLKMQTILDSYIKNRVLEMDLDGLDPLISQMMVFCKTNSRNVSRYRFILSINPEFYLSKQALFNLLEVNWEDVEKNGPIIILGLNKAVDHAMAFRIDKTSFYIDGKIGVVDPSTNSIGGVKSQEYLKKEFGGLSEILIAINDKNFQSRRGTCNWLASASAVVMGREDNMRFSNLEFSMFYFNTSVLPDIFYYMAEEYGVVVEVRAMDLPTVRTDLKREYENLLELENKLNRLVLNLTLLENFMDRDKIFILKKFLDNRIRTQKVFIENLENFYTSKTVEFEAVVRKITPTSLEHTKEVPMKEQMACDMSDDAFKITAPKTTDYRNMIKISKLVDNTMATHTAY